MTIISVNGVDPVTSKKLEAGSVVIDFEHVGRRCSEQLLQLIAGQQVQAETYLPPSYQTVLPTTEMPCETESADQGYLRQAPRFVPGSTNP